MKKKYLYCFVIYLNLLFIANNLYAQEKKYHYRVVTPHIESSYYYTSSYSKSTLIYRNQMLLSIKVLDHKGYPAEVFWGRFWLITESGDTIRLEMTDTNVLEKKIKRQSFSFNADIDGRHLENKNVHLDSKYGSNNNKISLTIILGTGFVPPPILLIHAKRELTAEELDDICHDYIFGTKKSQLIKDKDYHIGFEI